MPWVTQLTTDGRALAAVLACGEEAVLSHRSAALLWGVRGGTTARWHVTSPTMSGGLEGPPSVATHRTRRLPPEDVAHVRGIPVTTLARTLVDLAQVGTAREVGGAVHEAEVLRLLDVTAVEAVIARLPGRRGIRMLRAALARPAEGPSRTAFVTAFLELCEGHGLPTPRTSVHLDMGARLVEVDALFAGRRLLVELDGEAVHGTSRSFHADRRRDAALAARGYLTLRLTWQRVTEESAAVAEELRRILALRRP